MVSTAAQNSLDDFSVINASCACHEVPAKLAAFPMAIPPTGINRRGQASQREIQMKKIYLAVLMTAAVTLSAQAAEAQSNQASHSVSFEVQAINSISVSGSPSLTIVAANAGSAPTSVSATASYSITTNEVNQKVTASIDADMPSGVTLSVLLAEPTGASATQQNLSTVAKDVLSGVSTLSEAGLSIGYTLSATAAAGVVPADSRTVTYTIIAGS